MIITLKKKKNLREWHNWFAWYPVKISEHRLVWMTKIQQRVISYEPMYGSPYWEYRLIEKTSNKDNDCYSNNEK